MSNIRFDLFTASLNPFNGGIFRGINYLLHNLPSSVLPIPHSLQELAHVDPLGFHIKHPRVFQHAPRGGASTAFFLQTDTC